MDSYLSKPIRSRQVLEAIEQVVVSKKVLTRQRATKDRVKAGSRLTRKRNSPEVDATADGRFRLNRSTALAAVDGDEALLRDVAEAFLSEAPVLLDQASAALKARDARGVSRAAHTLKGAIASFGEHPAGALALKLEQTAQSEMLDQASELLDHLRTAVQPLLEDLKTICFGSETPSQS